MKLGLNNSATNYYPFGMIMPGRVFTSSTTYKFGYQCSLKDDEITVAGGSYGTFHRELDVRGDHWWSIDPETKAWESPYVSMGDNPIRNNDVRGNSATDWVKGKDGHARYDKNVHKKEDVKIGDEYLGKNIFMHDKSTGTTYYWEQDKLKAVHLSEVTISAARTPSTPLDRAMGQAIEAYQSPNFLSSNPLEPFKVPSLVPNAYGITGQVSFIPGGGASQSLSIGVVDHHFGIWSTTGGGVGADVGMGFSLFAGYHTGNTAGGFNSYMGFSQSCSLGGGPFSAGGSTDISRNPFGNYTYGQNWNTFSIGLGIGLPVSGSTQVSVSNPLLIYPSLNPHK